MRGGARSWGNLRRPLRMMLLDTRRPPRVGFQTISHRFGGASVLVNGAVFKTVCETVRTGSGGFDSHTPPPHNFRLRIAECS